MTEAMRERIVDALVMSPLSDNAGTSMGPVYLTADAVLAVVTDDDLRARIEALATDFEARSVKAGREFGGYPEASADIHARESTWEAAADDLRAALGETDD